MTIDPLVCRETEEHVLPQRKFYPAQISLRHPQLRHFLSSPQSNILYYANKTDVYSLDTSTQKRTHVAELPFETRCTATGHGWFCAGGDNHGYFAAFRLPEVQHPPPSSSAATASLPRYAISGSTVRPRIRVERLGNDIVNSVSIHTLPTLEDEDEVVAVISENDNTVRMYSLSQDCEIHTESFPFKMNHATLSPDGKLLAAVGDKEYIYFYERYDPQSSRASSKKPDQSKFIQYRWHLLSVFELHRPFGAEYSAYFTTAWSPSGTLCATASENGYITIFDAQAIARAAAESEAIVGIIPSSQPSPDIGSGSIRTMCFSSGLWDLLIWSESSGRVCIGDLRNGLRTRQVVDLDPEGSNVQKIYVRGGSNSVDDLASADLEFDSDLLIQRYVGADSSNSSIISHRGHLEQALERRRLQAQIRAADLEFGSQGLTEEERQIIEGLRTTRQREDALHQERLRTIQQERVNLPSHLQAQLTQQQRLADQHQPSNDTNTRIALMQREQQAFLELQLQRAIALRRTTPRSINYSTSPLQDVVSESSTPHSRPEERYPPVQSNGAENRSRTSSQARHRHSAPLSPSLGRHSSSGVTAMPSTDPWRTIEEAMERATSETMNFTDRQSLTRLLARSQDLHLERDIDRTLDRLREHDRNADQLAPDLSVGNNINEANDNGSMLPSSIHSIVLTPDTTVTNAESSPDGGADHLITRLRLERARAIDTYQDIERRWRIYLSSSEPTTATRERFRSLRDSSLRSNDISFTTSNPVLLEDENSGTAGVALSQDGRTLYAATHQGIFELNLNYHDRKFFAAVEPR